MFGAKRVSAGNVARVRLETKLTAYYNNSRKSREPHHTGKYIHSILCKIGDGKNVVTRVDKQAPGPRDDTAPVRIIAI